MNIFFEVEFFLCSDFGRRKINDKTDPSGMEKNVLTVGGFFIPYKSLQWDQSSLVREMQMCDFEK